MEKINIADLLRDCPEGMELDCTIFGTKVIYQKIYKTAPYPIVVQTEHGFEFRLTQYGQIHNIVGAECVIFPKGKTTWEGFQRPFKDGDIVCYLDSISIFKEWGDATLFRTYVTVYLHGDSTIDVAIPLFGKSIRREARLATEEEKQKLFQTIQDKGYEWNPKTKTLEDLLKFKDGDVVVAEDNESFQLFLLKHFIHSNNANDNYGDCYFGWDFQRNELFEKGKWSFNRLATKEETERLFKVIENNNYKWSPETKTLEKLTKLKFHEGQWITKGYFGGQITSIDYNDHCYRIADFMGGIDSSIPFTLQDNYHLWTIQDAKDGDVICYDDGWTCIFKYIHGIWYSSYCFITRDGEFHTSYEEHAVDSTINGNVHPATKEQCSLFFQKIKEAGYRWNPEKKTLEKLPKFKVGDAIRHKTNKIYCKLGDYSEGISAYRTNIGLSLTYKDLEQWELAPGKFDINKLKPFDRVLVRTDNKHRWSTQFFERLNNVLKDSFVCMGGWRYHQCIPYEGNEHLLDTSNEPDDFYKTWESEGTEKNT